MTLKEFSSAVTGQTASYVPSPRPHVDYVEVVWLDKRFSHPGDPPKVIVTVRRKSLRSDRAWCTCYTRKALALFRPDRLFRVKGGGEVLKAGDCGRDGKTSIIVEAEVPKSRLNPPDPARLCLGLDQARVRYAKDHHTLEEALF